MKKYIFDFDGKLLYGGEPLDGNTVFDFKSPDKRIVNKIPKTLHDYEKAVYHAKNNHYFYTDEKASFELLMYTNENTDFTEVNVTLYDAFFKKLTDVGICGKESLCFDIPSYSLNKYSFVIDELPIGVYHIGAALSEGGKTIKEHYSAFEVLDESCSKVFSLLIPLLSACVSVSRIKDLRIYTWKLCRNLEVEEWDMFCRGFVDRTVEDCINDSTGIFD